MIGLQETRQVCDPVQYGIDFIIFASQPVQGQEGCQLWLNRRLPFATAPSGEPIYLDATSATILVDQPRLLIVLTDVADAAIAFVVAHASTSSSPEDSQQLWWDGLSAVRRIPRRYLPCVLIDANARFEPMRVGIPEDTACGNHPARHLRASLSEQRLVASGNQTTCGQPIVSWVSPLQRATCIDYIAVPAEMASGLQVQGSLPGFIDCFDFDHRPVCASLQWVADVEAPQARLRFDRKALLTPAGRVMMQRIFRTAPRADWDEHADVFVRRLNAHITTEIAREFPLPRQRPRQLHISEVAWRHIRLLRTARRNLRYITQTEKCRILRRCFHAWSTRTEYVPDRQLKEVRRLAARSARLVRDLHKAKRLSIRRAVAEHTRVCFAEARDSGPEALSRLLRGILKTGRSYKPPRLAPALRIEENVVVGRRQTADALGAHFAAAERATQTTWAQVSRHRVCDGPATFDLQAVPSLYELANAFARLPSHKATGILQIPAEVYKAAPLDAAEAHWPLLLRMSVGREAPTLFKGGLIAAIPKPSKSLQSLSGWRNILLQEPAAKAISKSFRSRIVDAFSKHALPVQCGAQKGVPLELPMLYVRSHLAQLSAKLRSGGCLFVDAKDAYYSVVKHFLFSNGILDTPAQLEAAIDRIHPDEAQRRLLAAALVGPGLMAVADPVVQAYVREILKGAWTTTHADAARLYEATTGTTPGAPLADVLFQIIFSVALKDLQRRLEDCEDFNWQGDRAPVLSTWADDLAIPLLPESAETLVPAAVAAAKHAYWSLAGIGLEVNFLPGKTEALLQWRGAKSRELRRRYLAEASPSVSVQLCQDRAVHLTLTRSYIHLGGLVRDDACQMEEIQRRRRQAQGTFSKLRKRLFFNPHLSPAEKLSLLFSLVHRSFLHGAGFWSLSTKQELTSFHAIISGWYRASVRPLRGLSARGLTDAAVLDILGVLSPDDILHVERCRLLIVLAKFGDRHLLSSIRDVESWASSVLESASHVFCSGHTDFFALVSWIAADIRRCQGLIKTFRRRQVQARQARQAAALAQATALQTLHRSGGTTFTVSSASTEALHVCTTCGLLCGSKASLASHRSKVHGVSGCATTFFGTVCHVCKHEFWTTPRLQMHLRKRPECRSVFRNSDLDYQHWEFVNDPGLARKPAVAVSSPRPFWATLRPPPEPTLPATIPDALPVLLRCLQPSEPADVFRGLVQCGVRHRSPAADFARLSSAVANNTVSGAPGRPLAPAMLCTIVLMAGQAVDAVLASTDFHAQQEGFVVTVESGRCTFCVV